MGRFVTGGLIELAMDVGEQCEGVVELLLVLVATESGGVGARVAVVPVDA